MAEMTTEDLQTMYANRDNVLANAINNYAMRPQKDYVLTNTASTSTPYALEDLIAARDSLGSATRNLDEALKQRENFGYTLASALASVPQQEGYGSWLSGLGRSFGAGLGALTNAKIDRAQQIYDAQMKDLANRLAFDKAMGETTTQSQEQEIRYKPMQYGAPVGGSSNSGSQVSPQKEVSQMETTGGNLSDLYQTVAKNPITFSYIGGIKQGEESRALRSAVTTKGLTDMGHREFLYLNSIMPKGFATAINTAAEQKIMRPYTTEFEKGTGSAKKASIINMMGDIYDTYKNEAEAQGLKMPMSKQDYINQRLKAGRAYNPKYYTGESDKMYLDNENNTQPVEQQITPSEYDIAEEFMKGTI